MDTLKECIYDVKNGLYETSQEAKIASGAYVQEGYQPGQILINSSNHLLGPNETITGNAGEVVEVQPAAVVSETS